MRRANLLGVAVAVLAAESMPQMPAVLPSESRRDPYEPKTRFRKASISPAERLMERQRQRNLARRKP